jgi:hypothetical protein
MSVSRVHRSAFVSVEVCIFWVIAPCGLVGRYRRFGETYRIFGYHGGSSEHLINVVSIYQTGLSYIPEDIAVFILSSELTA